jgi:hypothetical protein
MDRAVTGWTRAQALRRGALAGTAVLAGGALATGRSGAAEQPSKEMDAEILGFLLGLEQLQTDYYRQALQGGRLTGELREYADTVARQEEQHARFLADRIGGASARKRPEADFRQALASPEAFQKGAVELEEAALAAYIAQGASLTRGVLAEVAPLVSVEARQAAWIRDLAGVNPAPKAADPGADPDAVLARLRDEGLIK